jgi:hypothetical protein
LLFLPLFPHQRIEYSLPESATDFALRSNSPQQFNPKEDLAIAAAEELRASGIFKEVMVAPRASEGDLVLNGVVKFT